MDGKAVLMGWNSAFTYDMVFFDGGWRKKGTRWVLYRFGYLLHHYIIKCLRTYKSILTSRPT